MSSEGEGRIKTDSSCLGDDTGGVGMTLVGPVCVVEEHRLSVKFWCKFEEPVQH